MSDEKLIRMANQIALFMETRPPEQAAEGVAAHINDFWAPPMRQSLLARIAENAPGLHPLVRGAAPLIRPAPQG